MIDPKSLAWQIITTNPLPKSESLERKKKTVCWILQKFSQMLNEGQPWLFSPPSTLLPQLILTGAPAKAATALTCPPPL